MGWLWLSLRWKLRSDGNPTPTLLDAVTGLAEDPFPFPRSHLHTCLCEAGLCVVLSPLSFCFPPCLPWRYVGWGCLRHLWYWDGMRKKNSESLWVSALLWHFYSKDTSSIMLFPFLQILKPVSHFLGIYPSSPHQILTSSLDDMLNKGIYFQNELTFWGCFLPP